MDPPTPTALGDGDEDKETGSEGDPYEDSEKDIDEDERDDEPLDEDPPIHKQLLEIVGAIKNRQIDWEKRKEYFGKQKKRWDHLTEKSERNDNGILHFLILDEDGTGSSSTVKEKAKAVRYIVKYQPQLLMRHNKDGMTPLYLALDNQKFTLVKGIFRANIKEEQMAKAISLRCTTLGENCLHYAMKSSRVPLEIQQQLVAYADHESINAKSNGNFTPLHRAVHYRYSSEERFKIVQKLIEKSEEPLSAGDGADSQPVECALDTYATLEGEKVSVYEYHVKTREETLKAPSRPAKQAPAKSASIKPPFNGIEDTKSGEEAARQKQAKEERDRGLLEKPKDAPRRNQEGNTQSNRNKPGPGGSRDQLKVPEPERAASPNPGGLSRSVTFAEETIKKQSAEQEQEKKQSKEKLEAQQRIKWSDEIQSELRLHCLRTRTIAQSTQFLYGKNNESKSTLFLTVASDC